jgi:cytochrome P450
MRPMALDGSRNCHVQQQQDVSDANRGWPSHSSTTKVDAIDAASNNAVTAATTTAAAPNSQRTVYQSRASLIMVHATLVPVIIASATAALLFARYSSSSPVWTVFYAWTIVLPCYAIVWSSWIYPFYVSELRHVPTVPGFPLWGHVYTLVTEECGLPQRHWHKELGPIVRYFLPLGAERISIAGDDALRHVLHRNPYNYPKPMRVRKWMGRVLGNGVLLAEGSEHILQRKILAPAFSLASIRALTPIFWEKALLVGKYWDDEIKRSGSSQPSYTGSTGGKSKTIEVLDWLNRCTLDIIGQAMFGYDIDSLRQPETPLRQAYRLVFSFDVSSRILHVINAFIPASRYLPYKMNRDIEKSRYIILDKATDIIRSKYADADGNEEGKAEGTQEKSYAAGAKEKVKDIVSLIAKASQKLEAEGQTGLSIETMRDQIMTFLGAGHDTTAAGVAWTLHILSKHPEVQSRLRAEIGERMPVLFSRHRDEGDDCDETEWLSKIISALASTDPDQLPYLHNVCRESLRYLPPIPLTVRQSVEADNFSGYCIPAGTPVYIFPSVVNRLSAYWGPTADVFDPDRWDHPVSIRTTSAPAAEAAASAPLLSRRTTSNGSSSGYMTFLQGPRGCIGRKFAETEMKVLLCVMLSAFEFSRDETRRDPEEGKLWRLVIRPKDGMNIRVTRI